jgi:hypothetical protein
MGAVGIVSAIEAVRDGHRVTVIEALGFEPEAAGRLSKTPPAAPRISGWGATGVPSIPAIVIAHVLAQPL